MALKRLCLLLLWNLALLVHCVTSLCNVTCSTDYDSLLNCSCSGSVQTYPVLLQVSCSGGDEQVNGSCEVKPPQTWCMVRQENLYEVASIGNMCSATASPRVDGVILTSTDSSSWALSDVVKPQPPFKVQVTHFEGFYNISWAHNNTQDCLIYRLRVRESKSLSKDPVYSLYMETMYIHLHHDKLRPRVGYTGDLQAKMCPDNVLRGPWSEWSGTVEWTTRGRTSQTEGMIGYQWLVSLAILPVLCLLWLCFIKKQFWLKKLQVVTCVPKPDVFFKPLYHDYGGDFKEWVKPVFSEYDYLRINQVMSEKQQDVLQWCDKRSSHREEAETGHFLQPGPSSSFLAVLDDSGSSSQGTGRSVGHVSIHTVTLSGEEFDQEAATRSSTNSLRCFPDGESFGSFAEDHVEQDLERPELEPPHELSVADLDFQPRVQMNEPERISLDSFASNGPSEDGYPQVDLDTVDSGFVECSSPAASDSGQMDLFHELKNSNSNYVKQWMVCNAVQEDRSHSDSEPCETL